MSETATARLEPFESPLTPESWGKLGMWIFLVGDAMTFGTLLAAYGAVRFASADWPHPADVLGINMTAFMTFLLICSSVTMVKGLSAARHDDLAGFRRFIGLTILGGAIFLGLQAYEWTHLIHSGLTLSGNPWGASLFGTTFFIITGFHGMHVLGGVGYLLCILALGWNGKFNGHNYHPVEIAGLYWHFVDLVWIMVFTFVYLL
ncbi:MAG: bb3-type cytochrome oxidase subunit IV [Candidatus Tectimicrobiota bacterium]|nr:MAG: bb3-type cytochrome oxidase subunit IV [Candidatus Tectomicrobia bacterium]